MIALIDDMFEQFVKQMLERVIGSILDKER
jgi:hypothetical protein